MKSGRRSGRRESRPGEGPPSSDKPVVMTLDIGKLLCCVVGDESEAAILGAILCLRFRAEFSCVVRKSSHGHGCEITEINYVGFCDKTEIENFVLSINYDGDPHFMWCRFDTLQLGTPRLRES